MKSLIAYYRVSTQKQGRSGLGLDAQRATVEAYARANRCTIVGEYVEMESGKRVKRPQLDAALAACKAQDATLIVAKIDRLARNAHFLLTLLNSGLEPVFCDLPQISGAMGRFFLTCMAAVAELEAGLISERTIAALAAAKERGVTLGGLRIETQTAARDRAEQLRGTFQQHAHLSATALAERLNELKIATPTGAPWSAKTVIRVQERLAA